MTTYTLPLSQDTLNALANTSGFGNTSTGAIVYPGNIVLTSSISTFTGETFIGDFRANNFITAGNVIASFANIASVNITSSNTTTANVSVINFSDGTQQNTAFSIAQVITIYQNLSLGTSFGTAGYNGVNNAINSSYYPNNSYPQSGSGMMFADWLIPGRVRGSYYNTYYRWAASGSGKNFSYNPSALGTASFTITNSIPTNFKSYANTTMNVAISIALTRGYDDTGYYYITSNGTTVYGPINIGNQGNGSSYTNTIYVKIPVATSNTFQLYTTISGGSGGDNLGLDKFYGSLAGWN